MSERMKALRNRNDIETVSENDKYLYIGFRPSSKDLISIVQKAPALDTIYMPKSYFKTLSKSMMMMLEMKNVQVKDEGVQKNEKITSCYILNDKDPNEPETQDTPEDQTQDIPEDQSQDQNENVASTGEGAAVPSSE